jgi:hypothetical protein
MYRDLEGFYRKPEEPRKRGKQTPKLTKAQQKMLIWALGIELLLLFLAPIGGSSVVTALFYLAK